MKAKASHFAARTVKSLVRNMVSTLLPVLKDLGFECRWKQSENVVEVTSYGRKNRFYLFGGRDESSSALIQGITLAGILFDEVVLMPRSFVEQALARCSVEGAAYWFNCNPENPQHWFYQEWIRKADARNALYLHFEMEDNPSLSETVLERYRSLYSGSFYERFVLGKWVAAEGLVYPFMKEGWFCDRPAGEAEEYAVSCDYGTANPSSFGLWGLWNGVWYRVEEYYYDSRREGRQRTDEEHYAALEELAGGQEGFPRGGRSFRSQLYSGDTEAWEVSGRSRQIMMCWMVSALLAWRLSAGISAFAGPARTQSGNFLFTDGAQSKAGIRR